MLIHCLTLVFKDSATSADVEAFRTALAELPARLPFAIRTRQGADLGVRPTNADYAVVTEFEHAEDFGAYLVHPAHLAVPKEHVASVQSVQFELDEPF
ncbi:Dabb family protein [Cryptosporangium sp. NPDC048952]|uniref:Dabb family protein n=1 Tax=Cryptosporangium sp. NPDC048952 TaxID=3363961 RepID=UPI003715C9E0